MNLYLLSQDENRGYDTFDSCVVAAPDEEAAKRISPDCYGVAWPKNPAVVRVELLGTAVDGTPTGVILASFNAG